MPLEPTLTSLDGLDESLHDEYESQEDGTYRLKLLSGYTPNDKVEDVSGLKSALQKERENAKNATRTLSQLKEQFGEVDVEKYQELLEKEAHAEEEAAKKAGEWDKLKEQQNQHFAKELEKRDGREQMLLGVIKDAKIDAEVVAALNKLGGNVELLQPHVQRRMKLIEEDGQFNARVVDDTGTVRVNANGDFMTAEELVSEMRDQESFATAFKADVKSGGGTPAGDGSNGADGKKGVIPGDLKRSAMTPRQKVDFINEHGNDKYQSLPM